MELDSLKAKNSSITDEFHKLSKENQSLIAQNISIV